MANKADVFEGDGLSVGGIYTLVEGKNTELIPRDKISYVSAKYQAQPLYLVIAAIAIIYGVVVIQSSAAYGGLAIVLGIVLIVAFFATRKVGVVIASSGGSLFVESRGRNRFELMGRIYRDLAAHTSSEV